MKLVHKPFSRTVAFKPKVSRTGLAAVACAAILIWAGEPARSDASACARDHCIDGRVVNVHADHAARHAVTEPVPGEYRFEVRPGDRGSMDRGAARERAELSFDEGPVGFDTMYHVSYEMLIEGDAPIESDWLVVGQWHATDDAGDAPSSPILGISLKSRDLAVFTQSEAARHHVKNPPAVRRANIENIARNRWISIAYDVMFNPTRGSLRMWIDGLSVFSGDIPIGYADDVGPYFKFGIYRSATDQTVVVRYRNLKIRAQPR